MHARTGRIEPGAGGRPFPELLHRIVQEPGQEPPRRRGRQQKRQSRGGKEEEDPFSLFRNAHFTSKTSPAGQTPPVSGAYMASAQRGGTAKRPRVTARA